MKYARTTSKHTADNYQATPNCNPRPHMLRDIPIARPSTPTTPHHNPITRPSTPTNSTPQTMDQYLAHLATTNDQWQKHRVIQTQTNTYTNTLAYTSTPSSPTQSKSSSDSSASHTIFSNDSDSDISTLSMASDRQLRPHIPINHNQTLFRRLHSHPQVRVFNNVSIPLDLT